MLASLLEKGTELLCKSTIKEIEQAGSIEEMNVDV